MNFKQLLLVLSCGLFAAHVSAQSPAEMVKNFCQGTGSLVSDGYQMASGSLPGLVITNATLMTFIALEMKYHHYKDFSWANFKEVYRKAMDRPGDYKMFLFLVSSLVAFDTKVLVYDPIKMILAEKSAKNEAERQIALEKERLEAEQKIKDEDAADLKALNDKIDNEPRYKEFKAMKDQELAAALDANRPLKQVQVEAEIKEKREEFKKKYEKERRDELDRIMKEQEDRLKAAQKEAQIQSEVARAVREYAQAEKLKADAKLRNAAAFNTNVNTGLDIVSALLPRTT